MDFRSYKDLFPSILTAIFVIASVACTPIPLPPQQTYFKEKQIDLSEYRPARMIPLTNNSEKIIGLSNDSNVLVSRPVILKKPEPVKLESISTMQRVQNGIALLKSDEWNKAQKEFELVLRQEPNNRVALHLLRQIKLSPPEYFKDINVYADYEVMPGDTLSTIATKYLDDALEFHILAKLNHTTSAIPLTIGQKIKVPVKGNKNEKITRTKFNKSVAVIKQDSRNLAHVKQQRDAETEYQKGLKALKLGKPNEALVAFGHAIRIEPNHKMARQQIVTLQSAHIDDLHKSAMTLYKNQELDEAIVKWDNVLELNPNHDLARLYRGRAMELKERLDNLPSVKP